jgi:hypothetical protein
VNAETARPCPRCGGEGFFAPEKIAALAAELPGSSSLAAEAVRAKRLLACGKCQALREKVLCAYCGCFVLLRSRPAQSYCPHPEGDKWEN